MFLAAVGILAQAVLAALVFTVPGLALLERWREGRKVPGALNLACAFCLSSLAAGLLYRVAVAAALPAAGLSALAWVWTAGCLVLALKLGPRRLLAAVAPTLNEQRIMAAALSFSLLLMALYPLSSYPSLLTEGFGDPPLYYSVAADVSAGGPWAQSYWVGDYYQGNASYVHVQSAPALMTAFLFSLVGKNDYSLFLYDGLSGAILLALFAAFLDLDDRGKLRGSRGLPLLILGLATLPGLGTQLALGSLALPLAVAVLALASLWCTGAASGWSKGVRAGLAAALCMWLVWWRPEGIVLAAIALAAWAGGMLLYDPRVTRTHRIAVGVFLLVCAGLTWLGLDRLDTLAPKGLRFATVFLLEFGEKGEFHYAFEEWWQFNYQMVHYNLRDLDPLDAFTNPEVFAQIQAHPDAFARYVLTRFPRTSTVAMEGLVGRDTIGFAISPGLVVLLVGIGAYRRSGRPAVCGAVAYMLLVPLANVAVADRHLFPVIVLLLALAGRVCLQRLRPVQTPPDRRKRNVLWLLLAMLIGLQVYRVAEKRGQKRNNLYVPVAAELERFAGQDDLILTSYPQLVAYLTGRRTVGATGVSPLDLFVERMQPDVIVLIDERKPDYKDHVEGTFGSPDPLPGYVLAVDRPEHRFLIYVRRPAETPPR